MDDKSLNIDKNSVSATKETELSSPQEDEESAKEVKQLSPMSSDLPHGVEFSKLDDNSAKAPEQGSIASIHFHQANKESEILESENEISKSPTTIKTKMCEDPIVDAGTKRHKSHHSTSDRKIEDKPRIPADPACSGIISPRPSTSTGAESSYGSLELQGNFTNRNQEFQQISLQAIGVNDESSTSPSTSVRMFQGDREITVYSSCDENTKRDDTITGPLHSCRNESAKDSTTFSQSSKRTFLCAKEITALSKGGDNAILSSFSFSPSSMYPDPECTTYSYNDEDGTESSSSLSASARMFQGDQEITIDSTCDENTKRDDTITSPQHSCSNETAKDSTTFSQSSARMFQGDQEIIIYSSCDENTKRDDTITGPQDSCSNESAKVSTTFSQSSARMFQGDQEIIIYSSCDENTKRDDTITGPQHSCSNETAKDATTFSQSSASMFQGDQEITIYSSCDENAKRDDTITGPQHSCSNESAKDSTTFSQSSARTFLGANEMTALSKVEENLTIPSFTFSPSILFPDSEDGAYSYNYDDEKESPTYLSASVRMIQGDQEIAVHSSGDENARQEEIASGSSTTGDESENLGCTSEQEGSHKNSLEKA